MEFIQIYDEGVSQYAYLIGCDTTREAIVIDPQRSIDQYLSVAEKKGLTIVAVTETHIHADFLSGVRQFLHDTNVKAYLSLHGKSEGWDYAWVTDGDNVKFVMDNDIIKIGSVELQVMHTPGHTPEHVVFSVREKGAPLALGVVTGDFVFAGDLGRPDLLERAAKQPGKMKEGAEALYKTVQGFLSQPDSLVIWPGHGAGSACGKSLGHVPYTTWGYEKRTSPALQRPTQEQFVSFITADQKEPPLYFARMKRLNNKGSPLLDRTKTARELTALDFSRLRERSPQLLVVDTRASRTEVMKAHLPNTLFTPFASLSTAIGSMIEETDRPIVLVLDEQYAAEGYRRLVNLGYDNMVGFITPKSFVSYLEQQKDVQSIELQTFAAILSALETQKPTIVDVRTAMEYEASHLPGAIHAPYTRLPEFINQLPRDKRLYVHCASGNRASISVTYLEMMGFTVTLINDAYKNVSKAPGVTCCSTKTHK